MSSYGGDPLFGSGPSRFVVGAWESDSLRRALPGLDGELLVHLGRRGRTIVQTGRLQAESVVLLELQCRAIEDRQDGFARELIDNSGVIYRNVVLRHFERTTPTALGRGVWVDYRIEYLQLP